MCAEIKIFRTLFYFLQKGTTMSDELLQEQPVQTQQHPYQTNQEPQTLICQPGDRECLNRLVQAFSDCD